MNLVAEKRMNHKKRIKHLVQKENLEDERHLQRQVCQDEIY